MTDGTAEIKTSIIKDSGDFLLSKSGVKLTRGDLTREIGSTLTGNQFDKKILALTNPTEYRDQLKARMAQAEERVVDIYEQVYTQYYDAGMPHDMAKSLALQTARSAYAGFVNAINVEYPESTTGIYSIGAKAQAGGIETPTPFSAMSASEILGRR